MGYIVIPQTVPATKKLLLSQWFRVPAASIAAASAEFAAWAGAGRDPDTRPMLCGIIPLTVFGPVGVCKLWVTESRDTGLFPAHGTIDVTTGDYATLPDGSPAFVPDQMLTENVPAFNGETVPIDPSYVGIDCTGRRPAISVNIVMPATNLPSLTGPFLRSDSFSGDLNNYVNWGGTDPRGSWSHVTNFSGASPLIGRDRPETFRLLPAGRTGDRGGPSGGGADGSGTDYAGQAIVPDHWHHILFSIDVSNRVAGTGAVNVAHATGEGTSSACRMWLAFDDANLTGRDLSAFWPEGYADDNAVLTVNGYYAAAGLSIDSTLTDGPGTISTTQDPYRYSYAPANIPLDGGDFGVPATGPYVSKIRRVEMGPCQLFTNVTIDPAVLRNRRAFISAEGRPAPLSEAKKLIGKEPEVLLYRPSNWKRGRNTGTLAGNSPAPDGTAVGDIEQYKPNPSLHGRQSP